MDEFVDVPAVMQLHRKQRHHSCPETLCLTDLMAKVNASPKKKVQAKLNTSGHLMAPPADPSVNAPRKFSGFTGKEQQHIHALK